MWCARFLQAMLQFQVYSVKGHESRYEYIYDGYSAGSVQWHIKKVKLWPKKSETAKSGRRSSRTFCPLKMEPRVLPLRPFWERTSWSLLTTRSRCTQDHRKTLLIKLALDLEKDLARLSQLTCANSIRGRLTRKTKLLSVRLPKCLCFKMQHQCVTFWCLCDVGVACGSSVG